jgi:hypothetical protein
MWRYRLLVVLILTQVNCKLRELSLPDSGHATGIHDIVQRRFTIHDDTVSNSKFYMPCPNGSRTCQHLRLGQSQCPDRLALLDAIC